MKHFIASVLVLSLLSIGMIGCAKESTEKKETKITTPGGTNISIERETKKTGEDLPEETP